MEMRALGRSGLTVAPLVFGGNVFGWTCDQKTSFDLLDAFVDAGFNGIDTADAYSYWVPGNRGGESETIIGHWLKANPSKRSKVLLMTKVGLKMGEGCEGLSANWIERAVEESLRRLQTDVIDLYQSHKPDASVQHEETLAAYDKLIKAGKIRAIGASNLDAQQFTASLDAAAKHGLPRYETLQPEYNLYDRAKFDGSLRDLVIREQIGVITFYSLASGFLSGKYRSQADLAKSLRGPRVASYLDARGLRILAALDAVAETHGAAQAEVALAWIIAREGVSAPIASATNLEQLESLLRSVRLRLTAADIAALDTASA